MNDDHTDRISERAYAIWMQEGCPDGRHQQHWQQAEAEMTDRQQPAQGLAGAGQSRAMTGQAEPAHPGEKSAKEAAKPKAGRRKMAKN